MVLYANISQRFKAENVDLRDEDEEMMKDGNQAPLTPEDELMYKVYGYLITGVYSVLVILFGLGYKKLAKKITENENHQYQT